MPLKSGSDDRKARANGWKQKTVKNKKLIISNWYDCKGLRAWICEEYDKIYIETAGSIVNVESMAEAIAWLKSHDYTKA